MQEFADIRRRFDEHDRLLEAEWATTHPAPAVVVADWEQLLKEVKSTLWQVSERLTAAGAASGLNGHTAGVSSELMESAAALDRMHVMLTQELARKDCLAALDDRLAPSTAGDPTRALLYVDLDDFRSRGGVRDRAAGDEVLAVIALRLSGVMRVQDTVRHLGGDALACLLADWRDRSQLLRLVSKLADAASAPVTVGAIEVTARPTIGIATSPTDGASAAALLRHADAAMSRAKRLQTSYAFFDARTDA